jgi:hypothetical protein
LVFPLFEESSVRHTRVHDTPHKGAGSALEEFVRRIQARQILDLAGSGLWLGGLAEMRSDVPRQAKKKRRS